MPIITTDTNAESYAIVAIADTTTAKRVEIKAGMQLGSVDNTTPANKPVNTALAESLQEKVGIVTDLSEFISAVATVDFAFAEDQIYKGNPAVAGGVLVKSRSGVYGEYKRGSAATQIDIQGNIQYGPENLILHSEKLGDQAPWELVYGAIEQTNLTPAYSASSSVTKLSVGENQLCSVTQVVEDLADSQMWYTLSVYAKRQLLLPTADLTLKIAGSLPAGKTATAVFNLNNTTTTAAASLPVGNIITRIQIASHGWYRYSISGRFSEQAIELSVGASGASGSSLYVSAPQLERYEEPRAYISTTGEAAYAPRWIHDQTKTTIDYENLSKWSQKFDNIAWTNSGGTTGISFLSTFVPSPSGVSDAYQMVGTSGASSALHKLYKGSDCGPSPGYFTVSIFAKKHPESSVNTITLQNNYTGSPTQYNLNNGTLVQGYSPSVISVIQNAGDGWYRCSHTFFTTNTPAVNIGIGTNGNPSGHQYIGTGLAADSVYIWGFQVERGEVTRKYTRTESIPLYGVGRSPCLGLLSEFASANLLYDSQNFVANWPTTGHGGATTDGDIASQIGTRNPMGVVSSTVFKSRGDSYAYPFDLTQTVQNIAAGIYTISVFIKKINYRYFTLTIGGYGQHSVFDFDTGLHTLLTTANPSYSNARAEKFNDGWYRISISRSIAGAPQALQQNGLWMCNTSGNQGFGAQTDAKVHVWGMQLEKNYTTSSYIPTKTSSASASGGTARNVDSPISFTGNNFLNVYNANEGTLFIEYKSIHMMPRYSSLMRASLASNVNGNRILIGNYGGGDRESKTDTEFVIAANNNQLFGRVKNNGNVVNDFGPNRRAAFSYNENSGSFAINGDTSTYRKYLSISLLADGLFIGGGNDSVIIARARYYTKCLSIDPLIGLTTL